MHMTNAVFAVIQGAVIVAQVWQFWSIWKTTHPKWSESLEARNERQARMLEVYGEENKRLKRDVDVLRNAS